MPLGVKCWEYRQEGCAEGVFRPVLHIGRDIAASLTCSRSPGASTRSHATVNILGVVLSRPKPLRRRCMFFNSKFEPFKQRMTVIYLALEVNPEAWSRVYKSNKEHGSHT
jgi:hypothetical protein